MTTDEEMSDRETVARVLWDHLGKRQFPGEWNVVRDRLIGGVYLDLAAAVLAALRDMPDREAS